MMSIVQLQSCDIYYLSKFLLSVNQLYPVHCLSGQKSEFNVASHIVVVHKTPFQTCLVFRYSSPSISNLQKQSNLKIIKFNEILGKREYFCWVECHIFQRVQLHAYRQDEIPLNYLCTVDFTNKKIWLIANHLENFITNSHVGHVCLCINVIEMFLLLIFV